MKRTEQIVQITLTTLFLFGFAMLVIGMITNTPNHLSFGIYD